MNKRLSMLFLGILLGAMINNFTAGWSRGQAVFSGGPDFNFKSLMLFLQT